ncbi:MAG: bi-domain-containing oxidoreductase [Actinomycetota bacterium]|nr:bi-domain-containing oxidoreductase [Actinomycetota bacterium]
MKQVLQDRQGLTVVRDVPSPPLAPGSVLVRNLYSVISSGTERSRVELSQKSLLGKARERPDLVREVVDKARKEGLRKTQDTVRRKLSEETAVGYSSAGRVLEVGPGVMGIDAGDLVACAGVGHANHAEIVTVPRNLVAKVPEGVDARSAAFTTMAAISLHGVRLANVELGDRVAVIGCGLVGQLVVRLVAAAGCETFALDIAESRIEQALGSGADHALKVEDGVAERVLAMTGGHGVDAVLIAAASPTNDPLLLGCEIARDRASVVIVGDVPIEVPRAPLFTKELSLRVSRSYGPGRYDFQYEERGLDYPIGYVRWTEQRNMEGLLSLMARGRLRVDDLVDEVVPVDDAKRAYDRLMGPPEERPQGAIVLSYPEESANGNGHHAAPATEAKPIEPASGALRVGLLGPGNFANSVIVPAFQAAGARLTRVGGGSGPSAEAATRNHGFEQASPSEDALIGDPQVEAVGVCTRHGTHADLVQRALLAGRHVFVEKPLAMTHEELDAVMAAKAESGRVLAVGFNRRFAPLMREVRAFVADTPGPITATYRVAAGNLPSDHWAHDLEDGGGRLIGEGCHFVDCLTYVTGSEVVEVHASGHGKPDLPIQARDNVAITLTFADGSVGTILYVAQGSGRVAKERLEVFAGSRTAILDDYRSAELMSGRAVDKRKGKVQDKGHRDEIRAFVEGCRAGRDPVPMPEVENVSRATLAIVDSLRTQRAVKLER